MLNSIMFNILKVVLFPIWLMFKKQSLSYINQYIDLMQQKYLENTNTIQEKLLESSVMGNYNLVDNSTVKEVIREQQNNFETALNIDTKGVGSASIKYKF